MERCATSGSDAELRFPQALRCSDVDNWRLDGNSVDIYFCRFGHEGFPYESGRKNIEFNEADGSFTLFGLQQSDEGLYEIWHGHYRSMCVELGKKLSKAIFFLHYVCTGNERFKG